MHTFLKMLMHNKHQHIVSQSPNAI